MKSYKNFLITFLTSFGVIHLRENNDINNTRPYYDYLTQKFGLGKSLHLERIIQRLIAKILI